ncbi:hypothetical protein [Candidatus Poriferisodalis sp.]|uniref:hypothetical protein n=1 Tax=Candidatus Poriferisodalis sp. TaxID=3101277 RepID=UPI003B0102E6
MRTLFGAGALFVVLLASAAVHSGASLAAVPAESSAASAPQDPATSGEILTDAALGAIEDDLARAERTLGLLADDDADPAAVTAWLADPSVGERDDPAGAATRSSGAATRS